MDDLPRLLRRAIEDRALSHAEAAAQIGASQPQVGRWLAGAKPSTSSRPGLAAFLGLTLDQLDDAINLRAGVPPVVMQRLDALSAELGELRGLVEQIGRRLPDDRGAP